MSSPGTRVNIPAADGHSKTVKDVVKFSHIWTIENFSFSLDDGAIKSPFIDAGVDDGTVWFLSVSPRGAAKDSSEYISFFLHLGAPRKTRIPTKYRLSILNADQIPIRAWQPQEPCMFEVGRGWGLKKFIQRSLVFANQSSNLPNDSLTLHCEVSYVPGTSKIATQGLSVQWNLLKDAQLGSSDDSDPKIPGAEPSASNPTLEPREEVSSTLGPQEAVSSSLGNFSTGPLNAADFKTLADSIVSYMAALEKANVAQDVGVEKTDSPQDLAQTRSEDPSIAQTDIETQALSEPPTEELPETNGKSSDSRTDATSNAVEFPARCDSPSSESDLGETSTEEFSDAKSPGTARKSYQSRASPSTSQLPSLERLRENIERMSREEEARERENESANITTRGPCTKGTNQFNVNCDCALYLESDIYSDRPLSSSPLNEEDSDCSLNSPGASRFFEKRFSHPSTSQASTDNLGVVQSSNVNENRRRDGSAGPAVRSRGRNLLVQPVSDVARFNGDKKTFFVWLHDFLSKVHYRHDLTLSRKFDHLKKLLIGEAAWLIKSSISEETAYLDTLSSLFVRYGNFKSFPYASLLHRLQMPQPIQFSENEEFMEDLDKIKCRIVVTLKLKALKNDCGNSSDSDDDNFKVTDSSSTSSSIPSSFDYI